LHDFPLAGKGKSGTEAGDRHGWSGLLSVLLRTSVTLLRDRQPGRRRFRRYDGPETNLNLGGQAVGGCIAVLPPRLCAARVNYAAADF